MRRCHAVKPGKPVLMCHIVEGHDGKHVDLEFGREWEESANS